MAKKKNKKVVKAPKTEEKIVEAENNEIEMEIVEPDATKKIDKVESKTETKPDSKKDKTSSKKSKEKKVKGPNKLLRKIKETFSELKKVSWPTFRATVKSTGVVIIVVVIFTLVLFGIDRGLAALYNLIPR